MTKPIIFLALLLAAGALKAQDTIANFKENAEKGIKAEFPQAGF